MTQLLLELVIEKQWFMHLSVVKESTAKWLASRFEPGGRLTPGSSTLLLSANFSQDHI